MPELNNQGQCLRLPSIEKETMHYKKIVTAAEFAAMSVEQRSKVITDHRNFELANDVHSWKKANPGLWEEARNYSGKLGDSHATKVAELQAVLNGPPHRSYSLEEQSVLHENPESEVRKYYVPANVGEAANYDLSALKRTDPAKAFRVQSAAFLYGISKREPVKPEAPKPMPEPVATLTNEQCDTLSLPHGTRATTEELIGYLANIEKIKGEKLAKDKAA